MKIRITLLLMLLYSGFLFSQIINIPDPVFKSRLIEEGVDTNNDGEIQESEALSITNLSVNSSQNPIKIESLMGIEYFTNLTVLNCGSNLLSTLDLSSLTQLEDLRAYNNLLTSINLTGLTNLFTLWISENQLETIDLSNLTSLDWLYCSNNQITNLDVSSLINLKALWAGGNQISSINLLSISNLEYISLDSNLLTEIEINHFNNLLSLGLSYNHLTEIDISNITNLYEIYLNQNNLSELDCSNTAAEVIQCAENPNLTSINVQNNVISHSDPDLLYYGFYFNNLPNLESICMDSGEEQALSHSGYDPENVTVFTGPNCTLSINEFSMEETYMYPNPVIDTFTINTNIDIVNYTLFDIMGKQLIQSSTINNIKHITSTLNKGMYFLKLESISGNEKIIKFLKE